MIEVKGLDHIVLRTSNIKDMLHFYRDILHCPIERELPELGLTQLRAGSAIIDLVCVDSTLGKLGGKAPSQNGRNVDHFCLQIAPLEENALLNYLDQCGLTHQPLQNDTVLKALVAQYIFMIQKEMWSSSKRKY